MADTYLTWFGKEAATGSPFTFKTLVTANGAIGAYLPCRLKGIPTSADSVDLKVPSNVVIYDVIGSAASGEVRLESDGEDTYVIIDIASRGATNAGRNQALGIPMGYGKNYRVKVSSTLPA
ncbi:MAG: hypothetical protein Q7I94_00620 [Candidatus Contubernalis sp.]|nr:hypothetical protein [Candidatus Contubernalis sp.]